MPYGRITSSEGGEGLPWLAAVALGSVKISSLGRGLKKAYSHNYSYADRILERSRQDPSSHNFPYSFDDQVLRGTQIARPDGYTIYQERGTLGKKAGVFEIGVTEDGVIDHRFFKPDKK